MKITRSCGQYEWKSDRFLQELRSERQESELSKYNSKTIMLVVYSELQNHPETEDRGDLRDGKQSTGFSAYLFSVCLWAINHQENVNNKPCLIQLLILFIDSFAGQ